MNDEARSLQQQTDYHKGGTVRDRGTLAASVPAAYWEWFRGDGTRLRSGHFQNDE